MGEAFVWGLVSAASLVVGALVVLVHDPHPRALGLVMGFGSGALLSAVSFELVEEAVSVADGLGGTALGFFTGAIAFYAGDLAISMRGYGDRKDIGAGPQGASALAIVLGIVLDGVPESAVIGLTLLQGSVGVSMIVAVLISNIPESIAASGSLLKSGWTTRGVLTLWVGVTVICASASALGYALLDGVSPSVVAFVLAFAGGAILAMLSTTMMPEAYEHAGRVTGLATTVGFALAFAVNWAAD